jgi:cobalt/nickel transport system permease protein
LRQARIERWSRGDSSLHRRHAAVKILVAFALLISIGTLTRHSAPACALYLALLITGAGLARLPVGAVLRGATVVLPFALCFAVVSALAGDPAKGVLFIVRAWLSAQAAILLVATTPMPQLIAGLETLGLPGFLLQVMQFLYRYLMVLAQDAGAMIQAGSSRAGTLRTLRFREAAAIAGVLFARSYARAQAIHRAMISRGFDGRIPAIHQIRFQITDAAFGFGVLLLIIGVRGVFGWV